MPQKYPMSWSKNILLSKLFTGCSRHLIWYKKLRDHGSRHIIMRAFAGNL